MTDISTVLQQNDFEVRQLLRKSHIIGEPNIETIRRGYETQGDMFMMKLLTIITPKKSNFSNLTPMTSISGVIPTIPDTPKLVTSILPTVQTDNSKTSAWSFWDKLLNAIGKTGETINQFKTDTSQKTIDYQVQADPQKAVQRNYLYWIAGGFVLLLIVILIMRK